MAVGTQTKVIVGLIILVNALVLFNIRRAGPGLPRVGDANSIGDPWRIARDDPCVRGREGEADSGGQLLETTGMSSSGGGRGAGGLRAGTTTPGSGGGLPGGVVGQNGEVAVLEGEVGRLGEPLGEGLQQASPVGSGGVGGDEGVESNVLMAQVAQREKQFQKCKGMMKTLGIVPHQTWGKAAKPEQQQWDLMGCNGLIETMSRAGAGAGGGGLGLPDCKARPSVPSDPLIAVCAGSTTRGVPFPDETSLALFRFLFPSLARTADCGFRYLAVIGYDIGDGFFDGAAGRAKTLSWFDSEIAKPAAMRGLSMELELVKVDNKINKPGPVFTATTKAAYDRGANYIYRVNDDSEMLTPWARSFVNALEALGPPYGVVGPESLNNNILVHDFTHRLHMDIFHQQYYPPSLTDWYVDDWISRVYGNNRTIRAKNCKVEHHTGAHGQRYEADTTKARSVDGLVTVGARRIAACAIVHGAEAAARQILTGKLDGASATKARARDIP